MSESKPRILFVDDEPAILAGLQNALYKDRRRWDLGFANGGELALAHIRDKGCDVIVSDMRMPGMDGAMLLQQVCKESPGTVRIMLSGHAEREAIARALPYLHQLLSKPCDGATLRAAIERGASLASVEPDIRAHVGAIDRLPATAASVAALVAAFAGGPTATAAAIGNDPALAAKVLQLVNQAYFGAGRPISSIAAAVELLGVERIRYLSTETTLFAPAGGDVAAIETARAAAVARAQVARDAAPEAQRELVYTAALLDAVPGGALLLTIWGLPAELVDLVRARCA